MLTSAAFTSAAAPPSEYTLFVGVDLFVKHDKEIVGIRKLERKRALLDTPDHAKVPLNEGTGFSWKMATKVSSVSATIGDLESKRVFSPANDPKMQTMKMQSNVQGYLSDRVSVAQAGIARAAEQAVFADAAAANPYNSAPQSFDQSSTGLIMNADAALNSANMNMDSLHTSGILDSMTDADGRANQYDALELIFNVSADSPMADAFVVVVAEIKSNDTVASTSFHREIGQVSTEPRRVVIIQQGLPPGYELEGTKVYLFNYGEEIPTNLSERSYQITDAQAREFVQIDYLATHKNETLPARPVWSIAPRPLMAASNPRGYDIPVMLDVGADGKLVAIHESNRVIPDQIRNIVHQLSFFPALERGKPIASTITVNPADFFKN